MTLVSDQLSKFLIITRFNPSESIPLIPSVLHLTYVQNTGAAFGLLKGQQVFFVGFSLAVIAWMCWELCTKPTKEALVVWGCALVLGGAIGNLIDRVHFGYVVDFIDLRVWPVFNVGDSAITVGVVLLILNTFFATGCGTRDTGL